MLPIRVIKVGGSLLECAELPLRVKTWCEKNRGYRNVFLMGGGQPCNQIRKLHQRFDFDEVASHWICIEMMGAMAGVLQELLHVPIVGSLEELKLSESDTLFDCRQWCGAKTELPASWDVTSDSLAAILAGDLSAPLVLFKSTSKSFHFSEDVVDAYFEIARKGVSQIQWVNLLMAP